MKSNGFGDEFCEFIGFLLPILRSTWPCIHLFLLDYRSMHIILAAEEFAMIQRSGQSAIRIYNASAWSCLSLGTLS